MQADLPPIVSWILAASAVVTTGSWLGVEWFRSRSIGIPIGLWLIAMAGMATLFFQRRARIQEQHRRRRYAHASDGADGLDAIVAEAVHSSLSDSGVSLSQEIAASNTQAKRHVMRAFIWKALRPAFASVFGEIAIQRREQAWIERFDLAPAAGRPLRVGLDITSKAAIALVRATRVHTLVPVEFHSLEASRDRATQLSEHDLDACVTTDDDDHLVIHTREHASHDAATFDWAELPPLSYASVFPPRIDPAHVTLDELHDLDENATETWTLVSSLVISAASLSRSPARLTLHDRWLGRRVMVGYPSYAAPAGWNLPAAEMELLSLARHAEAMTHTPHSSAALDATLRAVSGWVCVADTWTDPRLRRRVLEAAARRLPDDPTIALRLAAVRIADGDDVPAFEALLRADKILRGMDAQLMPIDHLQFVQTEIDLGADSLMTLGRVAAGICLACAPLPDDRLDYIQEDVMDDARYSSWLTGRDADALLLGRVFRMLKHARHARPSPKKMAA